MELTSEEQSQLDALLQRFRQHAKIQEMKRYIQHGSITTYEHVERVTKLCFLINRRWHLGADERALVIGAFMHDFYLYDWHENDKSHRLHGYMWPLTITKLPRSREAWILCLVDKYISTEETFAMRKRG